MRAVCLGTEIDRRRHLLAPSSLSASAMTDGLRVRYCLGRDFHQPAAAAAAYFGFGELEEALIHGGGVGVGVDPGVITKNDVAQAKCKFLFFFFFIFLLCVSGVRTSRVLCQKGSSVSCDTGMHSATLGETCLAFCAPACRFPFLCKQTQCAYAAAAPACNGAMPMPQTWRYLFHFCCTVRIPPD